MCRHLVRGGLNDVLFLALWCPMLIIIIELLAACVVRDTELREQQWQACNQSVAQVALDQGAQQTVATYPGEVRGVCTCSAT
jgi:hypothetical protein